MKGQIEKRGEGVYRLRWYTGRVDGKRQYSSKTVRGTKKQAEKALRDVLAKQDRGLVVPSRTPTLKEFVDQWKASESAARLRARTLEDYLCQLVRHVLPKLGSLRVEAIRASTIERELVGPLRDAGKLRTARLCVSILSKVLRAAVRDDLLAANPCSAVDKPGHSPSRPDPLSDEEREKFRAALRGTEYEIFHVLRLFTGLRPNEAAALTWECVDLEAGELRVERTIDFRDRYGGFHGMKTKRSARAMPIVSDALRLLRELHLKRGRPGEGLLFVRADGTLPSVQVFRKSFRRALKAAGIDRRVRQYDLRHGFATAGLEAGLDTKDVSELMGHASIATTADVYQHVSAERRRASAARIAMALGGAASAG
jgi:integrase